MNEISSDTTDQYKRPEAVIKKAIPDGGILAGRNKGDGKITINDPRCSGIHARFVENGIIDYSTVGTYFVPRYRFGLAQL